MITRSLRYAGTENLPDQSLPRGLAALPDYFAIHTRGLQPQDIQFHKKLKGLVSKGDVEKETRPCPACASSALNEHMSLLLSTPGGTAVSRCTLSAASPWESPLGQAARRKSSVAFNR